MHNSDELLFPLYRPFKLMCFPQGDTDRMSSHLWRLGGEGRGWGHTLPLRPRKSSVEWVPRPFCLSAGEAPSSPPYASFTSEQSYSHIAPCHSPNPCELTPNPVPAGDRLISTPKGDPPLGMLCSATRKSKDSPACLSSWGTDALSPPWGLRRRQDFKSEVAFDST